MLRADNAGLRLTPRGEAWGCIGPSRRARFARFQAAVSDALARARAEGATPAALATHGIAVNQDGRWRSALEVLGLPGLDNSALHRAFPWIGAMSAEILAQLEAEALYAPYLQRHAAERSWLDRQDSAPIPDDIDFAAIQGLSTEMRQRLTQARPRTLGAAARVRGVSPAAVAALAVHLRASAARRFT
jgi:tRNA uridine 5-carboxymethylaminomethyl modification enzyme